MKSPWLMQGDCLERMKEIPDGSVDMVLCDLPYGTTACKWDNVIPFELLWEQYNRIVTRNGAICLFGSEPFSTTLRMSNLKNYKYDWKWDKVKPSGFQIAKYRPMQRTEDIIVFCNGTIKYFPQMEKRKKPKKSKVYSSSGSNPIKYIDGKERIYTEKFPQSILVFSNANQMRKFHPTQKPVPLLEYLIRTYTNEGETVLDNCMGSGSTGVACLNTGRRFIGIELDEGYFDVAQERIEKAKPSHKMEV